MPIKKQYLSIANIISRRAVKEFSVMEMAEDDALEIVHNIEQRRVLNNWNTCTFFRVIHNDTKKPNDNIYFV